MNISVSALVGIVVACGIVTIFAALAFCMWFGRRRRQKDEKRERPQRLASPRVADDEVVPGLESVFNPMASDGPGSIFDRSAGRMSQASHESILGGHPHVRDGFMSNGRVRINHYASPLRNSGIHGNQVTGGRSPLAAPPGAEHGQQRRQPDMFRT
ncbi:hypothetical protein QBC35DRAFT_196811 [Podospora australis]|uniref:Uncharacterized protein n=1 Tax=Podospora australis TaxID=1536484 RepID=A0AAN6X2E9_9PEZI|nr:hypothetical protein QBC35DRAFT_196811 [Podospora australis]